jgi:hypothetical protein
VSRHDKDVLQARKIDGWRQPRLSIEFADMKSLHGANEQTVWENSTYA